MYEKFSHEALAPLSSDTPVLASDYSLLVTIQLIRKRTCAFFFYIAGQGRPGKISKKHENIFSAFSW